MCQTIPTWTRTSHRVTHHGKMLEMVRVELDFAHVAETPETHCVPTATREYKDSLPGEKERERKK